LRVSQPCLPMCEGEERRGGERTSSGYCWAQESAKASVKRDVQTRNLRDPGAKKTEAYGLYECDKTIRAAEGHVLVEGRRCEFAEV
jgi:hypothetical protein